MSRSGESIIDLTFCNQNILRFINDWKVEDIESNSDHCYINFSMNTITNSFQHNFNNTSDYYPLTHINKKYCFKKANWDLFKDLLEQKLSNNIFDNIENEEELEQKVKT